MLYMTCGIGNGEAAPYQGKVELGERRGKSRCLTQLQSSKNAGGREMNAFDRMVEKTLPKEYKRK